MNSTSMAVEYPIVMPYKIGTSVIAVPDLVAVETGNLTRRPVIFVAVRLPVVPTYFSLGAEHTEILKSRIRQ